MKVKSLSPKLQNVTTNTSAGELKFEAGVCEMTEEQFAHLSAERFSFMQLKPLDGGEIEKQVEKTDIKESESKEDLSKAEPKKDPAELVKEESEKAPEKEPEASVEKEDVDEDKTSEEEQTKADLLSAIEEASTVTELKDIAEALDLPKQQWNARKTVESMKSYLTDNI